MAKAQPPACRTKPTDIFASKTFLIVIPTAQMLALEFAWSLNY